MTPIQIEREKKKKFLNSYLRLIEKAKWKRSMLQQLKADSSSVRGIDYTKSGIPRGKNHISDLSGVYVRIEAHEEELNRTMQRAEHVYTAIKRALDALDDPRGAYALSLRHIRRLSWKEIAVDMGLASQSRTKEIYVAALDRLEIPNEFGGEKLDE